MSRDNGRMVERLWYTGVGGQARGNRRLASRPAGLQKLGSYDPGFAFYFAAKPDSHRSATPQLLNGPT